MNDAIPRLSASDAVILVDVQPDFCPGGALPIDDGDAIIPVLQGWIEAASRQGASVYASRDWHPPQHLSFIAEGGPWPSHCVQDTSGAAYHPGLSLPPQTVLVAKGTRLDVEQYSALDGTGLAIHLRGRAIQRLWIGGLALDVCVRATVLDARKEGFEVHVIVQGCRPVTPEGGRSAVEEMRSAGAIIVGE